MKINPIALVSADLFANLAVVFMVCLGTLAPMVNQEVLTYIDSKATDKPSDPAAPDAHSTALLEVAVAGGGSPYFVLHEPRGETLRFANYARLLQVLRAKPPEDLRVRVDRRVPSGVYQDLLLDANKLGARVWQANDRK
jgi:hypothetical protein